MSLNFVKYWELGIGFLPLSVTGLVIWQWQTISRILDIFNVLSEGKEWSSRLKTPEDLLAYIAAHSNDVSLVAYEVGNYANGIFFNADKKRPLASTIKILVLAEYARQVEQGILLADELVNLYDIDIYYLPGTDGNAHPNAVKELRTKGYINTANQIELRHITWAMIRYSDNAATDYLIERLQRKNIENLLVKLSIENQDAPLPIIGQFLSWSNHKFANTASERLQIYQAMQPQEYADEVYHLTDMWRCYQEFRSQATKYIKSKKWLGFPEQKAMAQALNCSGTAREYAQIMEKIYSGLLISQGAVKIMREYLEWAMEFPSNQQELDAFGAKGGSLAGIVTEAWYVKPKNAKNARVFALFLENLPAAVWLHMMQNYIQQEFGYQLLVDEKFFDLVRQRLSVKGTGDW
ncbi:MAG: serine hydrolase [Fischerella sp.]|uniref:serine hydrolase n=1 Tax=Fischerella sp. TaxID=1191 RepID=UPI0017C2FB33|nr:serine hydrolase [Fischerella sp.]NWF60327.1 serine hydrolase [Fischerella sp.]